MLKKLNIKNFTVFEQCKLDFSPGINVIIGENGTGKSHLLKLCFCILSTLLSFGKKTPANEVAERSFAQSLMDVFRPETLGRLAHRVQGNSIAEITATWGKSGKITFSFSTRNTEKVNISDFNYEEILAPAIFIPPKEILSIFEGFQGSLEKRELAFDSTYLSLAKALNPAPLKGRRPSDITKLIDEIEKTLNASIVKKDNKFYFNDHKKNGLFEAQIVAEGYRKLGMLAYLMLNGEIRKSSSLFWDEPEANINPKLISELVKILIELSKDIQIMLATHSLFLIREFGILQNYNRKINNKYFGINFNNGSVILKESNSINGIGDIASLDANINQDTRYLQMDID